MGIIIGMCRQMLTSDTPVTEHNSAPSTWTTCHPKRNIVFPIAFWRNTNQQVDALTLSQLVDRKVILFLSGKGDIN